MTNGLTGIENTRQEKMALKWFIPCILALLFSPEGASGGSLKDLDRQINEILAGQPGVYSVSYRDLASGREWHFNADDRMHAASTMKVPVMLRVFQKLEQENKSLNDALRVHNSFKSIVDGSAFAVDVDSDNELYQFLGKNVPIEHLVRLMIIRSSNLATNILIDWVDAKKVTELMVELGARQTSVLRGVQDLKAFEKDMNNTTTSRDMLQILISCYQSELFTKTSRDAMIQFLLDQEFNDLIPAGIPSEANAKVAHKTGSISRVHHDAALVMLPDGSSYGLVVFSRDFGEERERVKQTIRNISSAVYQYQTQLNLQ
ncbi:MAG: serine hydrolase [Acidobacteria bacterium]|nr:MAG: serine hydrolase [Acidobacteriota bacterium]